MLHRNWWRKCRSRKIRGDILLVYVFLEAGPGGAGQYTGLYRVSVDEISDYTGLSNKAVETCLQLLEKSNQIVYDYRKQVVFVQDMLDTQSPNFGSSENSLQGVAHHVERMPEGSKAVLAFIKHSEENYPELFELIEGYLEGYEDGDIEQTLDLRP